MCVNVIREFRLHGEAQLAEVALESLYAGMTISVHFQTPRSSVALAAIFTLVRLDVCKLKLFYNYVYSYINIT